MMPFPHREPEVVRCRSTALQETDRDPHGETYWHRRSPAHAAGGRRAPNGCRPTDAPRSRGRPPAPGGHGRLRPSDRQNPNDAPTSPPPGRGVNVDAFGNLDIGPQDRDQGANAYQGDTAVERARLEGFLPADIGFDVSLDTALKLVDVVVARHPVQSLESHVAGDGEIGEAAIVRENWRPSGQIDGPEKGRLRVGREAAGHPAF